jgi:hypothetical protein
LRWIKDFAHGGRHCELTAGCSPARFHLRSMSRRVRMNGDPWEAAMRRRNDLGTQQTTQGALVASAKKTV